MQETEYLVISTATEMENKILIIGVGSAGVKVTDMIRLPNSKKIFVDSGYFAFDNVRSEGEKLSLVCKERPDCPCFLAIVIKDPLFARRQLKITKMR